MPSLGGLKPRQDLIKDKHQADFERKARDYKPVKAHYIPKHDQHGHDSFHIPTTDHGHLGDFEEVARQGF